MILNNDGRLKVKITLFIFYNIKSNLEALFDLFALYFVILLFKITKIILKI